MESDLEKQIARELVLGNEHKAAIYAELIEKSESRVVPLYFAARVRFQTKKYDWCLACLQRECEEGGKMYRHSLFGFILMLECVLAGRDAEEMRRVVGKKHPAMSKEDAEIAAVYGISVGKSELNAKVFHLRAKLILAAGRGKAEATHNYKKALEECALFYDSFQELFYEGLLVKRERDELVRSVLRKESKGTFAQIYWRSFQKEGEIPKDIARLSVVLHVEIDRLLGCEEYEEAARQCRSVLETHGLFFETGLFYVAALYNTGDLHGAYEFAIRLVSLDPKNATSWYAVGVFNMMLGKYEESVKHFGRATALCQHFPQAYVAAGHAHSALGENNLAHEAYTKAQAHVLSSLKVPLYIGIESMCMGDMANASRCFVNAIELCGVEAEISPVLLNEIAVLYYRQREYEKALGCFRRALDGFSRRKQWKNRTAVLQNTGLVCMRTGAFKEAARVFAETKNEGDRYFINTCLGFIAETRGKLDEAVSFYHKADGSPCSGVATMLLNPLLRKKSVGESCEL
ncbi:MAG: anaphase-promoting complex subunit Cdc16/Cut9 [Amphiamblys sp. WSBS2006]|nr:MAG: anaphase-promoting complex subunit Cdc16/Cut9 [Amphiamblys sp. WSBS2006]